MLVAAAQFTKRFYSHLPQKPHRIMVLCPGQGAQYVGMLQHRPTRSKMIDLLMKKSTDILGYDIRAIANGGPKAILDRTIYCQPAILISSIIAFESLKESLTLNGDYESNGDNEHSGDNMVRIDGVAGYSVGELSALYISGGISLKDVLALVKVRAESMQYACDLQPSGMLSVQGLSFEQVDELCEDVNNNCHGNNKNMLSLQIAIYQYPGSVLLGGPEFALSRVLGRDHKLLRDVNKVRISKIPVNGAFHTNIMKPAQDKVHNALQHIDILPNKVPLFSNQTGQRYNDIGEIREYLVRQICEPVQWYHILQHVNDRFNDGHFQYIYEVGPGKNLKTLLGKVNRNLTKNTQCIS